MPVAWFCPNRTCPNFLHPQTETASFGDNPDPCDNCDTDLVWRPA